LAASERIRIEVAFDGGQIMSAIVKADGADAIERALAAGEASIVVDAEDGRYTIRLDRVAYFKRYARDSRVGFGA
jgi:hypothetical protein